MKLKTIAVIPARYNSSRFPGKLLAKLGTKSVIKHVYDNAVNTDLFDCVVVGTDDQRIFDEINAHGGKVVLTSKKHLSGTDRISEVCKKLECCQDADIVVNIQGDEPFIATEPLKLLLKGFNDPHVQIASLMHKLSKNAADPNNVKVVCDKNNFALYFSRSLIPFDRDGNQHPEVYKHIGVYAYRRNMLFKFINLPVAKLETIEKLEQLRLLENGIRIKMVKTDYDGVGIDTPEDLKKAKLRLAKK